MFLFLPQTEFQSNSGCFHDIPSSNSGTCFYRSESRDSPQDSVKSRRPRVACLKLNQHFFGDSQEVEIRCASLLPLSNLKG